MNIALISLFRNATCYLPRFFSQIRSLQSALGENRFRLIAVEGDSTDQTRQMLETLAKEGHTDLQLVTCEHNGPVFGSTEDTTRFVQLSKVVNAGFEAINDVDDLVVYVESDLMWDADTIVKLLHMAEHWESGFDIFAPFIFHVNGTFYDVWGFRKDGTRFGHPPPYHEAFAENTLMEMDSVGSCLAMRANIARLTRIRNDYCLVGWCENARSMDFRIAAHSGLRVTHP